MFMYLNGAFKNAFSSEAPSEISHITICIGDYQEVNTSGIGAMHAG